MLHQENLPLRSHPRVYYHQEDSGKREIEIGFVKGKRSRQYVVRRDVIGDIDDVDAGGDPLHDSLHYPDKMIFIAKISD